MTNKQPSLADLALVMLSDANRFAGQVLAGPHSDLTLNEKLLLALRLRTLRFTQAIHGVAESRHFDAVGALLRVVLELGFVLKAVADDSSRLDSLVAEGQAEGRKALDQLRKNLSADQRHESLTDEALDEQIAAMPRGEGFTVHNWAGRAQMTTTYATLYRILSKHAHGGVSGTLDYFDVDAAGEPVLRSNIEINEADYYCAAAGLLLDSLRLHPLQTLTADRDGELSALEQRLRALTVQVHA